jgi:capsular exopolysaccharide synthesis family protein
MNTPVDQLVSLVAPASPEADQYRGLRYTIERMRRDTGLQMIAVTSPGAGDGKTVTTLNLAGSLAQSSDTRILVIDADLHRPSVAGYLGIDDSRSVRPGLVDAITRDEYGLDETVRRMDPQNLSVLLPGAYQSGAYELLNSPRLERLLAEARRRFDFVLIDTPPLLPLPDCRLLGQWIDGFIVVVAAHRTPRRALQEALTLLDSAKILGIVFNGDDRPLASYSGYYSYYGPRDDRASVSRWSARLP